MSTQSETDALNNQWEQERRNKAEGVAGKEWEKGIWEHKVIVPEAVSRERARLASLTPEQIVEEKSCSAYVDDLIEEAWALLGREAKAILAVNPDDEKAQRDLLQYRQYEYAKLHPTKTFEAGGKLAKPVGRFVKLRKGGWGIRITRSKVGETVQVQSMTGYRKQPVIKQVKLVKEIGTSLYIGREQ